MVNSQRIFVDALTSYCARHGMTAEVRADGWLIVMQRGTQRRFAFSYDIGLNSAVAHRIANDKAATSELLSFSGVDCVPHALFLNPGLNAHRPPDGSWAAMLDLLARHPQGLVVKPNEGTSGRSVFRVASRPALELAVSSIFASHASLAISPYLAVEHEVRVVMLDGAPLVVYGKNRPSVIGDGRHTLLELAMRSTHADQRTAVLRGMINDLAKAELETIVPEGKHRVLNWRHNLDSGSRPALLQQGEMRDACIALALRAANAIDIRFASVDLVRADGRWQVLEINSGVMMEMLGKLYPELVHATYAAALDRVFAIHPPLEGEGRRS